MSQYPTVVKDGVYSRQICMFGEQCVVVCDGNCKKAWGINNRLEYRLDPDDDDDHFMFADDELDEAPQDPGTYEGGQGKPISEGGKLQSKWCFRECERCNTIGIDEDPAEHVKDLSVRRYNKFDRPSDTDIREHAKITVDDARKQYRETYGREHGSYWKMHTCNLCGKEIEAGQSRVDCNGGYAHRQCFDINIEL